MFQNQTFLASHIQIKTLIIFVHLNHHSGSHGLPWWLNGKESACNAGDLGSVPGSGSSLRKGNGNQLIPVFLHGEYHGQRSLVGYSPWGHKELDMTEAT